MAAQITVPKGFKSDFDLVCDRLSATPEEIEDIRQKVRADFEDWGRVVQRMAAIWRYVDRVWASFLGGVGVLPSREQCETCIRAMAWMPADPILFDRLEHIELVELCGQIDGAILGPIPYEEAPHFSTMRDMMEYRALEARMRAELTAT
jgi:hypothetical protein